MSSFTLGANPRPLHHFLLPCVPLREVRASQSSIAGAGGQPGPSIMSLVLRTLLCLELILGQSTQARKGGLPQPSITAQPGPIVLCDKPVTIRCRGPAEAEAYKIFKEGSKPREAETSTLYIKEMKTDQTGQYCCSYRSGKRWSPHSAPLTLVMTGAYKKPSLSSMSGTGVASGDEVMLKCFSELKFVRFILIKEDGFHTIHNQSSTLQDRKSQAIFHWGPVTHTQAGTYRCYGAFNNDPYVWSHSSDPLELEIKEFPVGSTMRPTDPGPTQEFPVGSTIRPTDPGPTQGQSQNLPFLIGLPVAILLFLFLLALLFLLLHHRKGKNIATKTGRQPQAAESRNRQAPEARDPQDVTYLQVAFNGPDQGTFSTPRQTHTSEYATIVPK